MTGDEQDSALGTDHTVLLSCQQLSSVHAVHSKPSQAKPMFDLTPPFFFFFAVSQFYGSSGWIDILEKDSSVQLVNLQ